VKALLQSALEVSLSIVRANPTVLEGLGAHLEGNCTCCIFIFGDWWNVCVDCQKINNEYLNFF